MLSHNSKSIQIGVRCSRTKKCSLRYQINHFCQGFFQPFNLRKFFRNPVGPGRGTFSFTHPTSDILVRPHWSLRSYRNWRLVQKYAELPQEFVSRNTFRTISRNTFWNTFRNISWTTSRNVFLQFHHARKSPPPNLPIKLQLGLTGMWTICKTICMFVE